MNTTIPSESAARCASCGHQLAPDAAQGLCPKCLLAGAASPTEPCATPDARTAPPSIEVVRAAFPQLEILELIGAGGMGSVFKARQPKLDRLVALKLLSEPLGRNPAFAERFHREARVLARLHHPSIVSVFDFGEAAGFYYLVMEYVAGVNLRQAMKAGRFSPAEALEVVPGICEALQFAHEQGVLHRDIKPENILLDSKGRVKIADFGIAKLLDEQPHEATLTASGAVLGTPAYMAPEQFETPECVDHRADIFSLGVVFYELLTGELPLGRFAPPSEKTPLDQRVDAIVLRALAKEKELRQQSAGEVKTQVEAVASFPANLPKPVAPAPAPVQDFILCNPRLPRMAQAITVYGLLFAPFFWVLGLGLLDFQHMSKHPGAALIEGLWQFFGDVVAGFATTVVLLVGALKLRVLKPGAITWLRAGFWSRIGLGVAGLGAMTCAAVLDWDSPLDDWRPPAGEVVLIGLMCVAAGVEIAMLVWLRRNRARLEAACLPDTGGTVVLDREAAARRSAASSRGWFAGLLDFMPVWLRTALAIVMVVALLRLVDAVSKWIQPPVPAQTQEETPAEPESGRIPGADSRNDAAEKTPMQLFPPTPVDAGFVRVDLGVPHGQGVIFELLSHTRDGIRPLRDSVGYLLASPERDASVPVLWKVDAAGKISREGVVPWKLVIHGEGGVESAARQFLLPADIARVVPSGGHTLATGWLEPNSESVYWLVPREGEDRPGLGVRFRTFAHGLDGTKVAEPGFAGTGTNWVEQFPAAPSQKW